MACPNQSTLGSFHICGQFQRGCSDDDTFGEINVSVAIENPLGGLVCDPTTGAVIGNGTLIPVYNSADAALGGGPAFPEGNDGCWCTCALWPTTAEDPDLALQPGGLTYQITVSEQGGPSFTVRGIELANDAETDEEGPCGPCVSLKSLIPPLPSVPPTDTFCAAVNACLPPEIPWEGVEGAGIIITPGGEEGHAPTIAVDENWVLGLTFDNCSEVLACFAGITTDGTAAGVAGDYAAGWDITLLGAEPGQLLRTDANGGLFLDCAAIADCIPPETLTSLTGINAAGEIVYVDENGNSNPITVWSQDSTSILTQGSDGGVFLDCAAVIGCFAGITTDGDSTGISGDYANGWDITILGAGTGQLLTSDTNGGIFLDCAAVLGCFGGIDSADNSVVVTGDATNGFDLSVTHPTPPSVPFQTCADVLACMPEITGPGVTGNWTDGWAITSDIDTTLTCAEVIGCLGTLDSTDSSVTITGDHATGWDFSVTHPTYDLCAGLGALTDTSTAAPPAGTKLVALLADGSCALVAAPTPECPDVIKTDADDLKALEIWACEGDDFVGFPAGRLMSRVSDGEITQADFTAPDNPDTATGKADVLAWHAANYPVGTAVSGTYYGPNNSKYTFNVDCEGNVQIDCVKAEWGGNVFTKWRKLCCEYHNGGQAVQMYWSQTFAPNATAVPTTYPIALASTFTRVTFGEVKNDPNVLAPLPAEGRIDNGSWTLTGFTFSNPSTVNTSVEFHLEGIC